MQPAARKKKYVDKANSATHTIIENSKKSNKKNGYNSNLGHFVKHVHAQQKKADKQNKKKVAEIQYQRTIEDEVEDDSPSPEINSSTRSEFLIEQDIHDRTKKFVEKLKVGPMSPATIGVSSGNAWYFLGPLPQCKTALARSKYLDLTLGIDIDSEIERNHLVVPSVEPYALQISQAHPKHALLCNACGIEVNSVSEGWTTVAPIGTFHTACANGL